MRVNSNQTEPTLILKHVYFACPSFSVVQFCEMVSIPSMCRWAGPIIDVLLDYVGHVKLCSCLLDHLDSYPDWQAIKEKASEFTAV